MERRRRLRWSPADPGDQFRRHLAQLAVAMLRSLPQQVERLLGRAALLRHEDAQRLVDDAAGGHRLGELPA
jgi:hypothetical protein